MDITQTRDRKELTPDLVNQTTTKAGLYILAGVKMLLSMLAFINLGLRFKKVMLKPIIPK